MNAAVDGKRGIENVGKDFINGRLFFVRVDPNCKYKCPSKMRGELTIEEEIIVWLWKQ